MSKSYVTVGVCVKNCEGTIKDVINSILAQDYPHELMEVIIVDGCSYDKTVQIVKEILLNSDIKTRIFFENKGLGFARQIVVENATADFIIWVDGDMILPNDFVRKQVEFMEKHPKVGIAKGRYGFAMENSLVATLENLEFMVSSTKVRASISTPLGTSGCIYRVEAIRQAGGFDENIKGVGEDMDAENRVKAAGWKLCISQAHFYERRRRTWRALWEEYSWHGKGGFHIYRKNKSLITNYKIHPLMLLFKKLVQIAQAYKLTYHKEVFFLPIHYIFKRIGWCYGFLTEYVKWCRYKLTNLRK